MIILGDNMKKRHLKTKFKIAIFIIIVLLVSTAVLLVSNKILTTDNPKEETQSNNNTEEKTENTVSEAKLTIVGDFLFEQPYYDALDNGDDINNYFSLIKNYFSNDDLSIGNMEVVIGNENLESSGTGYNFCAPEKIGNLVSSLDLEVLSTANNHSYDRSKDGIDSTIDFFKNNSDIMTVGTNKTEEEVQDKKILNINDISFGFLSYTYGTNVKIPENMRYSVNLFRDPDTKTMTEEYKEKITRDVNNIRNEVDVLIVLIHWGIEFTNTPNDEQRDVANLLNELGVDIIVGSHSHSIQPIEWIGDEKNTLVYYSLGNFVSADDDISRTGEKFDNAYQFGLLSTLDIKKEDENISIENIQATPIINYYDSNMLNFKLIPLDKYTASYETTHYRYKYNFTKDFITNMYNEVITEEFRTN